MIGDVESMQGDYQELGTESEEMGEVEILGEMQIDPAVFISECITFRSTLAQLKKQSLNLVKDLEDARVRVEGCLTDTNDLRAEYRQLSQDTQDIISHLQAARGRIRNTGSKDVGIQ